jgi:hypothetical protein
VSDSQGQEPDDVVRRRDALAQNVATARAEVASLERELDEALGSWAKLDLALSNVEQAERLRDLNRSLARSWSFRLGRALLTVPRAVYLRVSGEPRRG